MAQTDFSGTWRFNSSKSTLQIAAPDATIFVIDHREPFLRLTRTHVVGQTSDTFELELTTDGKEVTVRRGDLLLRSRAYWEGETLVFDTKLLRAGEEGTNLVRYTLTPDGNSFVAEERFRSDTLNYDNTWVLDKE
jgi:hypothetical protein